MARNIDWVAIKDEYITGDLSYQDLAHKYSISKTAIANKAKTENWVKLKEKYLNETCTKLVQKTAEKISNG